MNFVAEELVYQLLVVVADGFGDSLRIVLASTNIAYGETIEETCYQTAASESKIAIMLSNI